MTRRDGEPLREDAEDRDDRSWAELEGGTEGPLGRGRDQEVINQADRHESVRVAADRGIVARELFDGLLEELSADSRLMVDRIDEDTVRVLTVRAAGPAPRVVTVQFDLVAGSIAIDRGGDTARMLLDVDPADPQPARGALHDEVAWVRGESGPG
jgi:hypothetical protein